MNDAERSHEALEGLYKELSRIRTKIGNWESVPEAFHYALREAEDSVRVYPADDRSQVVNTALLVDDISNIIRRLDLIRGGAWQVPGLAVCISPGDLTALATRLKTATQAVARQVTAREEP